MKINELFSKIKTDGDLIVLGELLIDFIPGKSDMRLDETGSIIKTVSGSAGICACAAAGFGTPCTFIGKLGVDAFSKLSKKEIEKIGINTQYISIDETGKLGLAFLEYTESGRNYEYYRNDSVGSRLSAKDIPEEAFMGAKVLHFPGMLLNLNESMKESCFKAAELAKKNNVIFSFDPNLRKEICNNPKAMDAMKVMISMADVIEPTLEEAKILTGCQSTKDILVKLHSMGPKLVVLTMDKDGALISFDNQVLMAHGIDVEAIDPTGAGDTFAASICYGIYMNMEIEDVLRFANAAATLVCTKRGAIGMALPSLAEVNDFVEEKKLEIKKYSLDDIED